MTMQAACSRELEEERRNCFVAITRAERTRTLTRAERYHGYPKPPAQFLAEMGIGTGTGSMKTLFHGLKLSGLLSFGPDGIDLPMERLNVLIGPNGSGAAFADRHRGAGTGAAPGPAADVGRPAGRVVRAHPVDRDDALGRARGRVDGSAGERRGLREARRADADAASRQGGSRQVVAGVSTWRPLDLRRAGRQPVVTMTVYIEGGGDGRSLRARFREGWRRFLQSAGADRVKIVRGGGREQTFRRFAAAVTAAGPPRGRTSAGRQRGAGGGGTYGLEIPRRP